LTSEEDHDANDDVMTMILSTYSVVFFFFFVKNVVSLKEGDKNGPQNVVFPKKKQKSV